MRFEFHPEALAEYEDAAHYYAECQKGLELRFIAAVEHVIQQIIDAPDHWPVLEPRLSISLGTVRPELVEGPFMVRQAHHERRCVPYFT